MPRRTTGTAQGVLAGRETLEEIGLAVDESIAAGARARSLARPGQVGEFRLRTLDDAAELSQLLARVSSVVIVGAGYPPALWASARHCCNGSNRERRWPRPP
jgi:hypothetical protein